MTVTWAVLALGLTTGMGIGALALGMVLIYRATRVINLAHAELGAAAAAVTAALVRDHHVPFALAAVVGVLGAAATGAIIEAVIIRPLRNAARAVVLIATLGVTELLLAASIVVVNSISNREPGYPLPFRTTVNFGRGVVLNGSELALVTLVPLLAVGLAAFLHRSGAGVAVRAASENREAARLTGIGVDRLATLVWALAGALAAAVSILLLAGHEIVGAESLGPEVLFEALAACVLARFTNLPRALAGGVAIGVIEQLVFYNWPKGGLNDLVLFLIVLAALGLQARDRFGDDEASSWLLAGVLRPVPRALAERRWWRATPLVAAFALFAVVAVSSRWSTNAQALAFTEIAAYAILAISTSMIVGVAGQVSLGQVGFFGLGAAVSYQLSVSAGVPFWLAFLGAGVIAGLASVVVGLPALRVHGLLFAVTTLGFALVAQNWLLAQPWLIGAGISVPRPIIGPVDLSAQRPYFVFALVILAGAAWMIRNLLRSGPGRQIVAVRDNEESAASFGVPVTRTKLLAFGVAGFLAGIGGAVYGHGLQNVSVNDFPVANPGLQMGAVDSLRIVAISVIGGLGSVSGAVVAAALIVGVDELTSSVALQLVTSSIGLLLLLLFLPGGLASVIDPVRARIQERVLRTTATGP